MHFVTVLCSIAWLLFSKCSVHDIFMRLCSSSTWGRFVRCGKLEKKCVPTLNHGVTGRIPAQASYHILYKEATEIPLLTANRHRGAAVSQVNSFQLQEWISPSWISLCLSRQPIVTKRVDMPPMVGRRLPRKHCQSRVNAFLATSVPKPCQGNTCSPASLSCESQWARQPKATCW